MRTLVRLRGVVIPAAALRLALSSTALFSSTAAPAPTRITVNSTSDVVGNDGLCTLREAITSANTDAASGAAAGECAAGSGDDVIYLSVSGAINLTAALPALSSNVEIVGGPDAQSLAVRHDTGGDYRVFNVTAGATVTIWRLTISRGIATSGGGILNAGTLTLNGCVVSGNQTTQGSSGNPGGDGGGVSVGGAKATFTNCTIVNNRTGSGMAGGYGGGIAAGGPPGSTTLGNTLVANNTVPPGGSGTDIHSEVNSLDYNLIRNTSGATIHGSTAHNIYGQDPLLGPLTDNGGPTQTHALLAGSPALDAGGNALARDANNNTLTADQRGAGRFAGAGQTIDIGAFEFHPSLEDITPKTTPEETTLLFPFSIGDSTANVTSVTAVSDNQTVAPNAGLFVAGDGPVRLLQLTPAVNQSGTANITVTVKVSGGPPMSDTFQLTVTPVNDAPVNTVPGPQATVQHAPVVFSAANSNAISVADIDAGTDPIKVTLNATGGAVTLGSTSGLSFVTGDGADDASVSFNGTVAAVNAALAGLSFKPAQGFSGAASLQIVTDDQGHNGSGGALSDTDTVTINVAAGGTLQFSASNYEVNENGTSATITVTRASGSAGAASVNFSTGGGTANGGATCAAGVDYVSASGTLSWADGETAGKTFAVTLCNDFGDAGDETIGLSLSNVTGSATLGAPATATLTISDFNPSGGVIQFSQAAYGVAEGGTLTVTVGRTGNTGAAAAVDYATDDGRTPSVAVPCSSTTGLALDRCDFTKALGTLSFAAGEAEKTFKLLVGDDSYFEGPETLTLRLSNPAGGAGLGPNAAATVTIADLHESAGNPIDDATKFVTQHYHDFLNREPDPDGLAFWVGGITSCGADAGCREVKRIDTSAAFFLSIEFQETGYLVERTYKTAYGDATSPNVEGTVPVVRFDEFLKDTQRIGRDVVVRVGDWEARLEANKQAYMLEFVQRQRFLSAFPATLTAAEFVDRLDQNAGGVLSAEERAQLVAALGAAPSDAAPRAAALRQVAEHQTLRQREFNRAFVLMQYFGYLRRNPDDAPEAGLNFAGWRFWLSKLEEFNGDYRRAEMVKAFISADEYRRRFGQQ
ncbi:MAG: DUF4214 domain-containing protein [Acidobacteria bacterium]|nr:DUF4214 domain-containing protein [Acidobacteriota bacterium]